MSQSIGSSRTRGSNPRLSAYQADAHPIELLRPAIKLVNALIMTESRIVRPDIALGGKVIFTSF